jgi:hypothetical protein
LKSYILVCIYIIYIYTHKRTTCKLLLKIWTATIYTYMHRYIHV